MSPIESSSSFQTYETKESSRQKFFKTLAPTDEKDAVISNKWVNLAILVVMLPLLLIFFQPTVIQFAGFYLIDLLAFFFYRILDLRIFYALYPKTRLFFPNLSNDLKSFHSLSDRLEVFKAIRSFPRTRSIYFLLASSIKVIPAFIYVMLVWGGPGRYLITFLEAVVICLFTFSFAASMSYIAYHKVATETLRKINSRLDWSDVIRNQEVQSKGSKWIAFEIVPISILLSFFCVLSVLILVDRQESVYWNIFRFHYVFFSVVLFIVMILESSRRQVFDGMRDFVKNYMDSADPSSLEGLVVSHNPILAEQQLAVNNLIYKIIDDRAEKDLLLAAVAERSKMEMVGQTSALFVHDISKFINNISMAYQVLKLKPNDDRLHEIIQDSFRRLVSLLDNLKRTIRENGSSRGKGSLKLAVQDAEELNRLIFSDNVLSKIEIRNQLPDNLFVSIAHPMLIQFIGNLMTNSVQNFVEHEVLDPKITISIEDASQEKVTLRYSDNGTGLSSKVFKAISGLNATKEAPQFGVGVGLRLIKKLIEVNGGSIEVLDLDDSTGTCFEVSLPLYKEFEMQENPVSAHRALESAIHFH